MKTTRRWLLAAVSVLLLTTSFGACAQLPAPNAMGVSTGHTHLTVPDAAKARAFYLSLGAHEVKNGTMNLLSFPGMYILLIEKQPLHPAAETSANHIAFWVNDYAKVQKIMKDAGAKFILDNAETGQMLADLPDGMRLEFQEVKDQKEPIKFFHTHLQAKDAEGLRDWYVKVFGAEPSSRRNLPSALIPGGQVDFIPVRGDTTPFETKGSAIDHIGFEVRDMNAFAAHLKDLGIEFTTPPRHVDAIKLTIAFITDPVGTSIEITQGLAGIE